MNKRTDVINQFSMFIHWEENRFRGWRSHPPLLKSMQRHLEQDATLTNAQYWIIFWRRSLFEEQQELAQHQLAELHLHAYLQEPCYHVAVKIWQQYQQQLDYSIEDYFQIGIPKLKKILADFNPLLNPNFEAYCFVRLKQRIVDELRQQDKTLGHTLWSRLLTVSTLRMSRSLERLGIRAVSLDQYLDAWECYKVVYQDTKARQNGRLQEPNQEQWYQITNLYNQRGIESQSIEQVSELVNTAGVALVQYESPLILPIIDGSFDPLPDIPPPIIPEDEEDQAELAKEFQKIYDWLQQQLETLDVKQHKLNPNIKLILELIYGQGLTQMLIAEQLSIDSSTVSRNIIKVKEKLASMFIVWSAENLDRPLQSQDIKFIGEALNGWLHYHYQKSTHTSQEN
jgi:RNA polymerase sigma factor (sigma-70 family)